MEAEQLQSEDIEDPVLHKKALLLYSTLYSTLGFDNNNIYRFAEGVLDNIEYLKDLKYRQAVKKLLQKSEDLEEVLRYFLSNFTQICTDVQLRDTIFFDAMAGIKTKIYQALVDVVRFGLPPK
jgi:hypothetical protein